MQVLSRFMNIMLGLWVLSIFVMGVIVTSVASNQNIGIILTGLLTKHEMTIPAPIPEVKKVPEVEEATPVPVIKEETPPAPQEWVPLATGKNPGSGDLKISGTEILPDGSFQLLFNLNGNLTDYIKNYQRDPKAVYIDFFGNWKSTEYKHFFFEKGAVRKIQMAQHKERGGYIRVSFIASDEKASIDAKAEINKKDNKVRIIITTGKTS